MPDAVYVFHKARKHAVAYAQKKSVLWPLLRRCSLSDNMVVTDAKKLFVWWRLKTRALHNAGWPDLAAAGKLQFARNCPPTIVVATSEMKLRPCKLSQICPWCHSRDTASLFERVAALLPARGKAGRPLNIIDVSCRKIITPHDSGTMLSAILREWKVKRQKIFRQIVSYGSYYSVDLEPRIIKGQYFAWQLKAHLLALVTEDYDLPPSFKEHKNVRVSKVASRKKLIPIIARARRYPVGLLIGDAEYVVRALNAKHNLRCQASLGCLRGLKVV